MSNKDGNFSLPSSQNNVNDIGLHIGNMILKRQQIQEKIKPVIGSSVMYQLSLPITKMIGEFCLVSA